MSFTRRQFLSTAALAGTALAQTSSRRLPNIVWFMMDDAGYGEIGSFGQKKIHTPHADRLTKQGIRFTDCYAGASVCAPSRCTLMTGLHSGHAAVRGNVGTVPLPQDQTTVATLLKRAGYTTGLFGKWGLGDAGSVGTPAKHGFDEAFGYLHQIHAHDYYPEFLWNNADRFPLPGNADSQKKQYSADVIAEHMLAWVRKNADKPFFLYASPTLPHAAFTPPDDSPYEKEDWPEEDKKYASMMTRVDAELGKVLDLLRELKVENDTVVFFTSDNGAPNGEGHDLKFFTGNGPLRGQKAQLYEGGLRIPMVVRWPGRVKAGTESAYPWAFWDFLPTAMEIAGQPIPKGLDGVSVLPAMLGRTSNPHPPLYWEQYRVTKDKKDVDLATLAQAVRFGDWKAIRQGPQKPVELYDLRGDIGESKDVAAGNAPLVAKAAALMDSLHTKPMSHTTGRYEWVGQPSK